MEEEFDDTTGNDLPDVSKEAIQKAAESVDASADTTKEAKEAKKNVLCELTFNADDAKRGFNEPWKIKFTVTDDKKGDLLTAVRDELNRIRSENKDNADYDKYEEQFKRWMQRHWNVPIDTFGSQEKFDEVYGTMDKKIDNLINAGVSVQEQHNSLNDNVLEPISEFVPE